MYFFYFDESGTRDPQVIVKCPDGSTKERDPLYVLTAVGLYERHWHAFDRAIAFLKLELSDHIYRKKGVRYSLADCEVKSTTLRIPKRREKESPFLASLTPADLKRVSDTYYQQIAAQKMILFSVVIDKRKLHAHMNAEMLHKKAYELCLERIEHYLHEFHPNHQGLIVMDDTQRQLNHAVAMKHAFFQREGNRNVAFRHIVEYPFFTDSKLSNGVQLADLCAYNVYRAFRAKDFTFPYFAQLLPHLYRSNQTPPDKLDGLKVFPDDSECVGFAAEGYRAWLKTQPNAKPATEGGLR